MKKKLLDGANIPPLAGIIQAVLFSVAGDIWFGRWYMGAIAGLIPSLALAFGSSRIAAIQSKRRRYLGYITMGLILILSPLVVSPALYLEISESKLPPGLLWAVAIGWASLPDMSVVFAGVVAGHSLFSLAATEKPVAQVAETGKQPKQKTAKVARKPVKDEFLLAYFQGNPGASDTQAAEHFGISRQAIGQRRKKLYKVDIR